jgi:L-amino acid N-acyltransferase YncA
MAEKTSELWGACGSRFGSERSNGMFSTNGCWHQRSANINDMECTLNPDEIRIRDARSSDAEQIARIWLNGLTLQKGYVGIPAEVDVVTAFQGRIDTPQGESRMWVAVYGVEIVGWQGLLDFGITQIARTALSSTYISEQWLGKKVGRALLLRAMSHACERGFNHVIGWIKVDNTMSIKLVLSLGWKFVGVLPRNQESDIELAYYAYAVPKPVT